MSRLFGSVAETRAPTRVLQRVSDGTLYRHAFLQKLGVKDIYDLHVWSDGEFVTTNAVKEDHEDSAIHEMHYHLYAPVTAASSVKIEGHVVWAKNLATGKSNRCGFTITATADDDMTWTVKVDLAAEDHYFLDRDKNTSVRDALKSEITSLKGLIEDVLNTADADLPEIEDVPEEKQQAKKKGGKKGK